MSSRQRDSTATVTGVPYSVIPAKAGIQAAHRKRFGHPMGPRLREDDGARKTCG